MASYFEETFPFMGGTYTSNFHSPWLNLPVLDPIGAVNSGILTLSRFKTDYAVRRSYPIASDLSKLFDLDRCFTVERIPVEGGKTLVLVNSHAIMLQRNLFYTAVTRAKRKVILVGSKRAVQTAVQNQRTSRRFTLLIPRLQGELIV